jgi:hypothetical protein
LSARFVGLEDVHEARHLGEGLPAGWQMLAKRCVATEPAIRPAPACTTMTARWWATMSCSSRAIRTRSRGQNPTFGAHHPRLGRRTSVLPPLEGVKPTFGAHERRS